MLHDPNNQFMHQIRYGGDEALQEYYRKDVQHAIAQKKQLVQKTDAADKENAFLNLLTEQEYAEFTRNRKVDPNNKYGQSGIGNEIVESERQRQK